MPNIITIDKIDKLLDGKHPDGMGDIKFRFKMGLFLAKPKKDPLTRAFLHGSLMDKAYDFDIPEDISEIPDETAEEIEGRDKLSTMRKSLPFSYTPTGAGASTGVGSMPPKTEDDYLLKEERSQQPIGQVVNPEDLEGRIHQRMEFI